jgi:hypothetical protein
MPIEKESMGCPVCGAGASLLDVVDLNKSCEEIRGSYLPLTGFPVYYALCNHCHFCWAPELKNWPLAKFEEYIYNIDYETVDPDYKYVRPKANANALLSMFPDMPSSVRHLDYGGGNGQLVACLTESHWSSISYDPFVNRDMNPNQLGKFDLITAFEVFEHVPDVKAMASELNALLAQDGMILFSTLISDGNIQKNQRLSWWYASPRNGHISLFSRKALSILAIDCGFNVGSFSDGFHVFFKTVPTWASHLIKTE